MSDTVLGQVAARAAATPGALAAVDPRQSLTYADLAARAAAVAAHLRERGVRPGDAVAVALPRSAGYAAAILGVWQAGAVFVPVDLTLPPERVRYQLDRAGAAFRLETMPPAIEGGRLEPGEARPERCAYVMFTSGSTGRPKAVQVSHASLSHCVAAVARLLRPGPHDRYAANQTFAFDIALLELFLPLTHGGATLVTSEALQADAPALAAWLEAGGVTVVHATPTAWRWLLPHLTPGRSALQAVCGGEIMTAGLAAGLAARAGRVWNFYGPTEVTVWCTAHEVTPGERDPLPVGRPLPGYRVELLDAAGDPVPPGQEGEIHVGGPGVALGYGGDPELTAERFIDHPTLGRLYRTGDMGRLRPDGLLHFAGRRDRQVQLGGHRVELGEIECVAQEHPGVELAAAHVDDGTLVLFAQGSATGRALRRHLAARLPAAMIPARIEVRAHLPLTPTRKIDRVALLASRDG
ncbi:Dimodular nonribosomal peptide synthase [Nonomuraea coxensis DSM 45129]|uniref:Dimodular nonribosomal peptide synthase n=1 Tax=Nonomuraea coxensis DSM 45129 TaxID=1122611 RepID=A0ABX8U1J3_9ACTN|nr:amino acid adenylation domain-containing protein [Nonomuraea coxensis]QYC41601.1 Dimodular nonribosomal peptide synthase [Nonomuraea coxensis DSM 45129]